MKQKYLLPGIVIILLLIAAFFIVSSRSSDEGTRVSTTVQRGPFEIPVYTSGQLEAENSVQIVMPGELSSRNVRIWEINITDIVEEGTVVDSGDYIASLDFKTVEELLNTAKDELEQAFNDFEDAKMDSNLNLSNIRDQIINAREEVEEMQIILDESIYESPSIIRKAEMDLEKAKRKLEQEIRGYGLKKQQAVSRVDRKHIELRQRQTRVNDLSKVYESLRIKAPKPGMVIYAKDRFGDKIKVGSSVSQWMPTIATLPDLTSMISITYVNEIDISKIKVGQKVKIGIDALPGKILEGQVITVANIGQPLPKSDAKVFEVKVKIFGYVNNLKPAMTTSNIIQTGLFPDTLFIPTDAVFENDSMQYVFLDNGSIVKQVVDLGDENENYIMVRKGLQEGDVILLTKPGAPDDLPIKGMDVYREIKKRKGIEEKEAQKAIEEDKKKPVKLNNKPGTPGQNNIITIR
ncbi:MAG: HlyD family efflux transporter periplasmic adaptor subunit [Chlorobi bacterium]|nr:HlyD family efflux transporter periplasmic adaptor subunit [Chlorobiota bacterium]